jgi:beta-lactamase regulating signal transducer with metallopeptidase domain
MNSTTVIAALGWALLDFLWQGLLVGALAALALLALRNARPQARYAVACFALAVCLALPLAGLWRGVAGAAPAHDEAAASVTATWLATPVAADTAPAAPASDWRQSLQAQMPAIVAAWSAGALLLALRLLFGCRWVGRLRASARLPNSSWQGRFDELAVRVGLRAPVPLRISDNIDSPVAAGWWRPVVLVPAALLAGMPVELMEALLAHELAHVRRRDYLVNLLQGVVETLLFYHPVVWWLSRQARVEREQIADDLASRALADPRRLALALQALDRFQETHRTGPARLPHAPGLLPAPMEASSCPASSACCAPTTSVPTGNSPCPPLPSRRSASPCMPRRRSRRRWRRCRQWHPCGGERGAARIRHAGARADASGRSRADVSTTPAVAVTPRGCDDTGGRGDVDGCGDARDCRDTRGGRDAAHFRRAGDCAGRLRRRCLGHPHRRQARALRAGTRRARGHQPVRRPPGRQ